mgnify:CR=1 FL=1
MKKHLEAEPLVQRISRVLAWVAGAIILFGCSVPITIDVFARYFFNRGVVESFEISGYALAACIGLGMAFTVTTKANIRVDLLVKTLPFPLRAVCDIAASVALALVAVALAWFAWGTLEQSWAMNAKSISHLQVPMVIPQGIWWIGLFWFAAVAVLVPIQAVRRLLTGNRTEFQTLLGSTGVADEIVQAGVDSLADAQASEDRRA